MHGQKVPSFLFDLGPGNLDTNYALGIYEIILTIIKPDEIYASMLALPTAQFISQGWLGHK